MTAKRCAVSVVFVLATAMAPAGAQPAPPPGASSCSGCHHATPGANAAVPPIHGRSADEIVGAMAEFRAGKRLATVMAYIAKGFTDGETRAIAQWLAAQR